ncbi:MAG: GNAT family N-acetyltransferase [Myxococcaceae bacterium]
MAPLTPGPPPAAPAAFRVRPARRGDGEHLGALLVELGHPGAGDTSTVHWVLSHPEIEVYVAADAQDRPIGLVSLSHRPQLRLSGRVATIDELVVAAAWRRKGVARALMQRALERARVLSVKRVELQLPSLPSEATLGFCAAMQFQDAELGVVVRAP